MLRALAVVRSTFPNQEVNNDEEFALLYAQALYLKQLEAKTIANEVAKIFLGEG